jgi:hypothetical protein
VLVGLTGGCSGERTGDVITSPPVSTVEYALATTVSRGVISNPAPGSKNLKDGSIVEYSFSASAGYSNVKVLLDGTEVATAGQFPMNKPHSLVASADTVAVLSKSDSGLVNQFTNWLVSEPPEKIAQNFQAAFDSLLIKNSAEVARATFARAMAFAVVPTRDAEKISRALAVPPNEANSLQAEAKYARHVQLSVTRPRAHTVLLFVNGINVLPTDYIVSWRGALFPLAQRLGISTERGFDVGGFYNPSVTFTDPIVANFWSCVLLKGNQVANGIGSALTSLPECMPGTGLVIQGTRYFLGDLVEALYQVLNLALFKQSGLVVPDAIRLADSVIAIRDRAGRVVLVTHSQGNLLAEETLLRLSREPSWTSQDAACVGWVEIAPPRQANGNLTSFAPSAMIIRGNSSADILEKLLGVTQNTSVRPVRNELSDTYDSEGWLWSRTIGWFDFGTGIALHRVTESYFGMPATEKLIGAAILEQIDALDTRCASPTATIQITSNVSTAWSISPGPRLGSGFSGSADVRAARSGTNFTITPASLAGVVATVTNSDGGGASMTLFPGDSKSFNIAYSKPPSPTISFVYDPDVVSGNKSGIEDGIALGYAFLQSHYQWQLAQAITVHVTASSAEPAAFTRIDGITINTGNPLWLTSPDSRRRQIMVHELFHVLQFHNGWVFSPQWLVEGSAEFVSWKAAYIDIGLFSSAQGHDCMVWNLQFSAPPLGVLSSYENANGPGATGALYYLAVEKLLGGQSIVALSKVTNFDAAFGVSKGAFYVDFETYRATLVRPDRYECVGFR